MEKRYVWYPHQDASLLLKDRISTNLWKHLKLHNETEGLGQLANHTCCDMHWNANLEVAAILLLWNITRTRI